MSSSVVTFSRKNRSRGDGGSEVSSSAASTYVTAPSVLTPVPESPGSVYQDENSEAAATSTAKSGGGRQAGGNAGLPANRWRRKNAAERQEGERRQHLADMRAYFQEVDAFELAVETPPGTKAHPAEGGKRAGDARPPRGGVAQALAAAAPTPGSAMRQRPMSLGLSRRRSSVVAWPIGHAAELASSSKANQSPLKLSMPSGAMQERQLDEGHAGAGGRRSILLPPAGPHRLSVAADNTGMLGSPGWAVSRHSLAARGRRSSAAPSRLSGTGKMLSRMSVGLTDALQWLGIKGRIPTAAGNATEEEQHPAPEDDSGSGNRQSQQMQMLDRPALFPIASPGGEEEDGSTSAAGDSPLPASMAVTALEQQPAEDELSAAVSSLTTHAAAEEEGTAAAGQARVFAEQPAVDKQPAHDEQPAQGTPDVSEGGLLASQQADTAAAPAAAAVEQSEEELAAKLQLLEVAEGTEEGEEPGAAPAVEQAASAVQADAATEESEEELSHLQQLLELCGQETDLDLVPSMDELLGQHVDLKKVRKIGEGTFGEAFKAGGVVLKIVPMEGEVLVNGEPQKRADEILAEVAITLTLSRLNGAAAAPGEVPDNVTSGFVETYGVGICRGAYSEALRHEWHRWDLENESENEEVDIFGGNQLFVVFVVANGGLDLEHFELRSFEEVRSILLQAALTVAVGEEACQFEHRDLHWGNLLIKRSEQPASTAAVRARLRGVELEAVTEGVTVTLIDFTLSRLVTVTGEVAFCDLAADPELFKGPKGNVQADTYRRMKKATKNRWQAHVPLTNVYWMQYLVDICMTEKKGWGCVRDDLVELRAFKRRIAAYTSCADLLFDDFLRPGLAIQD